MNKTGRTLFRGNGVSRAQVNRCIVFWGIAALVCFLVLCRVGYSDGDDAFFYNYTTTMGFFEYLSWRYLTWTGRLAGEALLYVTFHLGLWFWRVANAAILVLLPIGVLRLACKTAGYRGYLHFLSERKELKTAESAGFRARAVWETLRLPILASSSYFLMSVMTVGYGAVWVTGSVSYAWAFTAGVWAMMPLADAAFDTGAFLARQFLYAIPCSVIAALSVEQMGAVLLAFEFLAVFRIFRKRGKRIPAGVLVQTAVTAAAFALLFAAPGNVLRVESEIATWLPGYRELSFGEHFFLTLQWLLSSFANEGKVFFVGIWAAGILLLQEQKSATGIQNGAECPRPADNRGISVTILQAAAGVFCLAALLPYAGVTAFSDMGIGWIDAEQRLTELPSYGAMTAQNKFAFFWWLAAAVFTLFFLWKVSGRAALVCVTYLGGIASEAVLFFSPTMYASGARLYYLTDVLFLFLILWLVMRTDGEKKKTTFVAEILLLGAVNFLSQCAVIIAKM